MKRELLAQLIVKYEGAILEHDASSAALLFEMNDFHWILQIDIGTLLLFFSYILYDFAY